VTGHQCSGQKQQRADQDHQTRTPQQSSESRTTNEDQNRSKQKRAQHPADTFIDLDQSILPESNLSRTALDYKNAGNKLCALHRYNEALTFYSKAIEKDPEVAVFFSNRALCHLKLQHWSSAIQDCRRALELDPGLIKAHFFLGQALAELSDYDEALQHLQKAHQLSKDKNMNFGDDIAYQIRSIKRCRWNKIEEDAVRLEDELKDYLISLIREDKKEKLSAAKAESQSYHRSQESTDLCQPTASSSTPNSRNTSNQIDKAQSEIHTLATNHICDKYIEKLESIFETLKLQRKKRDVPEYLCGKISFEIMRDPVITPSGITYDRQDIEEHLKRVGHFDPVTRQPLTAAQLISNLALKDVVDAYLKENEWASYY